MSFLSQSTYGQFPSMLLLICFPATLIPVRFSSGFPWATEGFFTGHSLIEIEYVCKFLIGNTGSS